MCCQDECCGEVSLVHKAYTKTVEEKFGSALSEALPDFRLSRLQRNAHGGRFYSQAIGNGVTLFVALILHDNAEEFNIDIGFSRNGLCPEESFFLNPNDTFALPSILFRLSEFWGDKDPWWVIEGYLPVDKQKTRWEQTGTIALPPEEFNPKIDVLIVDATQCLRQYAVPYFAALRNQTTML